VVAWARETWLGTATVCRQFSVTISLQPCDSTGMSWSLAVVYGPVLDSLNSGWVHFAKSS
jgi:hypothetical protein